MKKNYRTLAYIGLGSNLQNPITQIAIALRELALLPESDLQQHSGLLHFLIQSLLYMKVSVKVLFHQNLLYKFQILIFKKTM